jgi:phosphoglycolate phosphatase-like HAD superfamily hydrolase
LNILFWDIDGTLIRTAKAGLFAFQQAAAELWSKPFSFDKIEAAGMTDNYIAAQIIQAALGRQPLDGEILSLTKRYEELLSGYLQQREGMIMPSVVEILEQLHQQKEYKMLLLTGNSRTGAAIKMKHFGLSHYFDFSGSAFCGSYVKRVDIAKQALTIVQSQYSGDSAARIFIIGDTPNDIQCGQAIGAYTIGVATGGYSLQQLIEHSPWWAVEALPSSTEFIAKLAAIT